MKIDLIFSSFLVSLLTQSLYFQMKSIFPGLVYTCVYILALQLLGSYVLSFRISAPRVHWTAPEFAEGLHCLFSKDLASAGQLVCDMFLCSNLI